MATWSMAPSLASSSGLLGNGVEDGLSAHICYARENCRAPPHDFLPYPACAPFRRRTRVPLGRNSGRWSGGTVTVDLAAEELETYERFQAALLRETGSPFRYLPIEPRPAPTQVRQRQPRDAAVVTSAGSARQETSLRCSNIACQTSDDSPW